MDESSSRRLPTWGDTPERVWLHEFLDGAFPVAGGKVTADSHFAMAMCREEPKLAQVALQFLAQEVRAATAPAEGLEFLRFALGVLFTAYCGLALSEGRVGENNVPSELEHVVRRYPEFIACANAIGPTQRS